MPEQLFALMREAEVLERDGCGAGPGAILVAAGTGRIAAVMLTATRRET